MNHPDDRQLQGYLDGELQPTVARHVGDHLMRCVECRTRLDAWRALSESIHETRPSDDVMEPFGTFWVQLADQLPASGQPPSVWPFAPMLPPVLLVVLGAAAKVILSLLVAAYLLSQLGVIPSLTGILGGIATPLGWFPDLQETIVSWVALRWQGLSATDQGIVVVALATLALVAITAVLATLYTTWALCWKAANRSTHNGGHS